MCGTKMKKNSSHIHTVLLQYYIIVHHWHLHKLHNFININFHQPLAHDTVVKHEHINYKCHLNRYSTHTLIVQCYKTDPTVKVLSVCILCTCYLRQLEFQCHCFPSTELQHSVTVKVQEVEPHRTSPSGCIEYNMPMVRLTSITDDVYILLLRCTCIFNTNLHSLVVHEPGSLLCNSVLFCWFLDASMLCKSCLLCGCRTLENTPQPRAAHASSSDALQNLVSEAILLGIHHLLHHVTSCSFRILQLPS